MLKLWWVFFGCFSLSFSLCQLCFVRRSATSRLSIGPGCPSHFGSVFPLLFNFPKRILRDSVRRIAQALVPSAPRNLFPFFPYFLILKLLDFVPLFPLLFHFANFILCVGAHWPQVPPAFWSCFSFPF